jgi:hypothetical protein
MPSFLQPQHIVILCILASSLAACGAPEDNVNTSTEAIAPVTNIEASAEAPKADNNAYWMNIANKITVQVSEAISLAEKGETKLAARAMTQVYFQQFEGSKMEAAIRIQVSPKHMLKVEGLFGELRKGITSKAPISTLKKQAQAIIDAVTNDAKELDKAGIDAALLEEM